MAQTETFRAKDRTGQDRWIKKKVHPTTPTLSHTSQKYVNTPKVAEQRIDHEISIRPAIKKKTKKKQETN